MYAALRILSLRYPGAALCGQQIAWLPPTNDDDDDDGDDDDDDDDDDTDHGCGLRY